MDIEQLKRINQAIRIIFMNRILWVFLLGLLAILGVMSTYSCSKSTGPVDSITSDIVKVYTYEIVNTYPHDPNAFTQGLVFENDVLYEGTGLHGQSTLRKVDLETGDILQIRELPPQFWGEGVTIYGNKLIQLTWQSNIGFVYDKNSFELLQEFSYPTEGWGITHDG